MTSIIILITARWFVAMDINTFLAHLVKVKKAGPGKWKALCPAHDDKSPSLSVAHADDGKILINCFACCSPESIVSALGLKMADLFVDSTFQPGRRRKVSRSKLENALFHELLILQINLNRRLNFKEIPHDDYVRERQAAQRVIKVLGELYV